ncbi:hypothetical protein [Pontixanthobacter luteolus]|uniref:hypothetical protein n=1 Tax=Pontixanthobacter luteolus TaxID=295089 RepID=UPI002302EDDD|nr:hypothetical protein [Pontixanthobacter luteolus]
MYRHFAVATVVITGAIALLADGEKREAIAREVAEIEVPDVKKSAPALIIRNDRVSEGGGDMSGFYSDTSSDTASTAGMDSSYIGGSGVLTADNIDSQNGRMQLSRTGLTLAQFNALSPEQKRVLLAMLNGETDPAADRKRAAEAAAVASLARSGGGAGADY